MIQNITVSQFCDAFRDYNRDNFSYNGLGALYDYLTEFEEDMGSPIELDVIALCCDYTEYSDLEEFQDDYGTEFEDIDTIRDNTTVIPVGVDGFIIQQF